MSNDTLALRFHHVPVLVVGDAARLNAFRSLVVADDANPDAPDGLADAITLRLLASRDDLPAHPPGVHATGDRHVHVVDEDVHATVDLESRTIEVFGEMKETVAPHTAMGRTLTIALSLALRERGIVALHAAAVLTNQRALLLVGDSGAGKTTTALALVEAGCVPMTDDRVFVRPAHDGWDLFSAPQEFRVTETTLSAFPERERHRGALLVGYDKYELDVAQFSQLVTRYSGEVELLFPRQTATVTTRVSPMSSAEALGELMVASPLVAVGGPARTSEHARVLSALARSNAAWLELGSDMLDDPSRTATRVLASLPGAAPR